MRELEFPAPRNFLTELRNRKQSNDDGAARNFLADLSPLKSRKQPNDDGAKGMFEVDSEQMSNLMFVGNDAVHTLGIEAFHAPIQEEVNKRMSLVSGEKSSLLRFAPLSLNPELEKNADMILGLTGMDQVCTLYSCMNLYVYHQFNC